MSPQPPPASSGTHSENIHEPDGVRASGVLIVLASLLLLSLFSLFLVNQIFKGFAADPGLLNVQTEWQLQKNSPGVEPNQTYDRERLQAAEQAQLDGYGWQDDNHQHAHIPIERAMEILAKKKLIIDWPKSSKKKETLSSDKQDAPVQDAPVQDSDSRDQEKPR